MNTIPVEDLPRTLAQREADEFSEHDHQVAVFQWAALQVKLGTHPELDLMFAIPNGAWKGKASAGRFKAEGLKPGVPDICLPISRGGYVCLWIEMKSERGRLSDEQRAWHDKLEKHGSIVALCFSHHQAKQTLVEYLDGKFVRPGVTPRDGASHQ